MTDSAYRIAPLGFTDDEWETFNREGILCFEDALDQAALDEITAAVDRVCQSSSKYRAGETFGCQNIVERDPALPRPRDRLRPRPRRLPRRCGVAPPQAPHVGRAQAIRVEAVEWPVASPTTDH